MTAVTTRKALPSSVPERTRALLTRLNFYYAGVAVLGLVCLYLLVQIAFTWHKATARNDAAMERQTIAMKTAEIAARPLQGLDTKLAQTTTQADSFYKDRLPEVDSDVVGELGALAKMRGVKLMRVQYVFAPVLAGSSHELTEMRMDARLTGDYKALVTFINALERDRMFFLIRGVTLTGEQGGTVGLRLGLVTYLRGDGAAPKNTAAIAPAGKGAAR